MTIVEWCYSLSVADGEGSATNWEEGVRPIVWRPPVEPSPAEQAVIKAVRRAKLFVFLRQHRHELFDEQFQAELAETYVDSPRGQPAIPWKRGHFPLADSCDFGSSSDYRTPVHLWFLASVYAPDTGSPDAPRPGRGRPGPARVSGRRGRSGLRGQGRPRRGRRRQAVRSSLEAGGAAPYPQAARPPAWNAAATRE